MSRRHSDQARAGVAFPQNRCESAGFTLVEVLACVAVIGVLVALLLPALSGGWRHARETTRLNDLRQLVASMSAYMIGSGDRFPTSLEAGGAAVDPYTGEPTPWTLSPNAYLIGNSRRWVDPLERVGIALPPEHDPRDREEQPRPVVRRTLYPLTSAAFATPGLFEPGVHPTRDHLRTQRGSGVRSPSSKGLLLALQSDVFDERWPANGVLAGLGDGSAARRRVRPGATWPQDSPMVVCGLAFPVMWTRHGLEGADF